MADSKLTGLTEDTSVNSSDLGYTIEDPSGTPVSKKATWLNILKGALLGLLTSDGDLVTRTSGAAARLTRASLAADTAFSSVYFATPGAWTSYTPSWTTTGDAPAIGNGSITGAWMRLGNTLFVRIYVTFGSTSTFGTGNFQFSLPSGFTSKASVRQVVPGVLDDSDGNRSAMNALVLPGDTKIARLVSNNISGGASATVPFTWATSDEITMTGIIEGTFA